jgi:hypothetical protein
VFVFFDQQATANDWTATAQGAWHVTCQWAKTYPDGSRATLAIVPGADPRLPPPATITWTMSGSISPPAAR